MKVCFVSFYNHACDNERCPSKFEEVVGCAYFLKLEYRCEYVTERTFDVVCRFFILIVRRQFRFWERLDVGLAVWCHRHFSELKIRRRNHILRQALRYFRLEISGVDFAVSRVICRQMFSAVNLTYEYHYFVDAFYVMYHVFNLAEFDTQSA